MEALFCVWNTAIELHKKEDVVPTTNVNVEGEDFLYQKKLHLNNKKKEME